MADGISTLDVDTLNQLVASGQIRSRYQPPEVANLEGFLFPETYRLDEGTDEPTSLQVMINQFDGVADQLDLAGGAARLGLTPYQVLTIASLIQEESGIPEDSPMISRVIYNRLAQGIPLGVDATICYALGERPCELTQADLEIDSPYNSRTAGRPPADADRRPRPGRARGGPPSGRGTVALLRARPRSRDRGRPLLHRRLQRVPGQEGRVQPGRSRLRLTLG